MRAAAGARCRTPPMRAQILYFSPRRVEFLPPQRRFLSGGRADLARSGRDDSKDTSDHKSMDDFCHVFYGGPDGEPVIKTYTFEDLVSTLNGIAPYDWNSFFRTRWIPPSPALRSAASPAVAGGLSITTIPTSCSRREKDVSRSGNFTSSIGLRVKGDGTVIDAIPGMPAFEAGLSPYLKIVGVNGRQFSIDELKRAVRDSKSNSVAIEVLTDNTGTLEKHEIQYHGGNRFPHLEKVEGAPDYLDEILKPLTPVSVQ